MFSKLCKNLSIEKQQKKIEYAEVILDNLIGFHTNLSEYKFQISSIPCSGTYKNNKIQINRKLDIINFESTLVHELSHALQERENIINPFCALINNNHIKVGIEEAFAYFNDAFVIAGNEKYSNLYEMRIEMIRELSYDYSPNILAKSFYLIKNSILEINKNNNKIVFLASKSDADQLSKQPNSESILGNSTALISFVSNDFSILKTSQELFKPWKNVLYNLNKKLNDKKQSNKIQNNLLCLLRIRSKKHLSDFIRGEIENKQIN